MHSWKEMGLKIPRILLPKEGTDMEKWAVVACDQYTSEPDWWKRAEELVGNAPSSLRLVLPEVYLGGPQEEKRTEDIRACMDRYIREGVLRELPEGCVLVERTAAGHRRLGLVLAVDLEAYDYSKGATSLIRATEKTIVDRIPPRLRIRRGASIELPHIIILIDDPARTVIEPLTEVFSNRNRVVYDTDLMLGGGHIRGAFLPKESLEGVRAAFSALYDAATARYGRGRELLMAMGDGNHSLATAKAAWEEIKKTLPEEQRKTHPARYALCEIENVHDEGIVFEPIHRVLFGEGRQTGEEMVKKTVAILKEQNGDACLTETGSGTDRDSEDLAGKIYRIPVLFSGRKREIVIRQPASGLEVGALQKALDQLVSRQRVRIDYIHGDKTVEELTADSGNAGFLLPAMDKGALLPAVAADGALPRKTFSMGHACEKRYYLEARSLRADFLS